MGEVVKVGETVAPQHRDQRDEHRSTPGESGYADIRRPGEDVPVAGAGGRPAVRFAHPQGPVPGGEHTGQRVFVASGEAVGLLGLLVGRRQVAERAQGLQADDTLEHLVRRQLMLHG